MGTHRFHALTAALLSAGIGLASSQSHAAVAYHFAADGDDALPAAAATHAATPWRSLAKLDSLVLFPGDSVLFKRGDTLAGTVRARFSGKKGRPIYYCAYGQGNPPVISGSLRITGWKSFRESLQVAEAPMPIRQLFLDGRPMTLARTPNRGYCPIVSAVDDRTFRPRDSSGSMWGRSGKWPGAALHIRSQRFSLDARRVLRYDADSAFFILDRSANYRLKPGQGFFLNNSLSALDTAGEWFYDSSATKVYASWPSRENGAAHRLEGSAFDYGFAARGQKWLQVQGLHFRFPSISGLFLDSAEHVEIRACAVSYPGAEGLSLAGGGFLVEANDVEGAVTSGIRLDGSRSSIQGNTVRHTGDPDRIGLRGFGGGCCRGNGIEFYGPQNRIFSNQIIASAQNGIRFEGADAIVEGNIVDSSCLLTDDAGGIYRWAASFTDPNGTGGAIRNNLILNTIGNADGTGDSATSAQGIYLDDCTRDMKVEGNTVVNADIGIYLHNTRNIRVYKNTCYRNRTVPLYLKRDYLEKEEMFGNEVAENVFSPQRTDSDCSREKIHGVTNSRPLGKYRSNSCLTKPGASLRIQPAE